jgi:signal transduction histidine kinase/DNA-binding response OmpR family regulator
LSFFSSKVSGPCKVFFCIFLICATPGIAFVLDAGDSRQISDCDIEAGLVQAESFIYSFKNDSALHLVGPMLVQLKKTGSLNTYKGLRVRLVEAISMEQKQLGDSAITRLLPLLELSRTLRMWDVFTRSCMTMALIEEKVHNVDQSLHYLTLAKECISEKKLVRLYPYFSIRMASWQRLFGNKEKAVFYAREALRTAPGLQLKLEEAIGHMLMSFLLNADLPERLDHCFKAIELYKELGDHTGSSAMFHQVSRTYFLGGKLHLALAFNDSSITSAQRAIASGHEKHEMISHMYSFRGSIFKTLENYDSAWFYVAKGHEMAINLMQQNINTKIAEIDTRYNTKKNLEQIEQQQISLKQRNHLLSTTFVVLIIMVFLSVSLYRNYRRQQGAKLVLMEQKKVIQHQADQLKELDATKTRLFANISHELRTPLTLILGPINKLIHDSEASDEQLTLLRMASQSGTDLVNMVNQILDLGKIDAGKMAIDKRATHLTSFFEAHLSNFESLASRKKIDYEIEVGETLGVITLIDREKYRRILYNLLSNAFKFTPPNGIIQICISIKDDLLELKVTDSGPGVHQDDLPHIFDRYFQSSRFDAAATGGTGIGLAICREYTHLLGGEISVSSPPGEGTTMKVIFPVERAPEDSGAYSLDDIFDLNADALPGTEQLAPKRSTGAGIPTVLLVEDDDALQAYIRQILEGDYRVVTATHGQEALDKLYSERFDLILSDLMMPVMDGYQLLQALKSDDRTRGLPVIMLTARAELDDKLKSLRIGVDDYITKPFDEQELKARIRNILQHYAARRETIADASTEVEATLLVSEIDQSWLERFERYIHLNYQNDLLSVPVIAHDFSVSESTLLRQLKRLTGFSPVQYIQEVRLTQARIILERHSYHSITDVASKVGYKDVRTFSRSFKNRFGKAPSELIGNA